MKKLYTLAATLLLIAGALQAQNRFDASIFGGLNFNQIDGDQSSNLQMALRGGVGTSFTLTDDTRSPWRMVVELAFTQKGAEKDQGTYSSSIALNYVELPIMMSYTMLGNKIRLSAGVAPAILVGARVIDNGMRNSIQEDKYLRFDRLPLTVSLRYLISYNLAIELHAQTSLLSIYDNPAQGTYRIFRNNMGQFNRTFGIGISYSFLNQ